jgi:hypothetical protein
VLVGRLVSDTKYGLSILEDFGVRAQSLILVTLIMAILTMPASKVSAREDMQGENGAGGRAVHQLADGGTAGVDVVDGNFDKTLPLTASFKTCDGSAVELTGSCRIRGSIETFGYARTLAAWVVDVDLSGIDDSTGIPYAVSFVRENEFVVGDSSFDVLFGDALVAMGTENAGVFEVGLKFVEGRIRLDSVEAEMRCP